MRSVLLAVTSQELLSLLHRCGLGRTKVVANVRIIYYQFNRTKVEHLDRLGGERLSPSRIVSAADSGASVDARGFGGLGVELKELLQVVLWLLEDFDLVDADVLEGEDALGRLFNLLANRVGDQLGNDVLEVTGADLAGHYVKHLLADCADLRRLGVAGLANLLWAALGETDAEDAEDVSVSGLDVNVCLNQRLPLFHHGAQLVGGEAHSVKVCQAGLALDLVNAETELAEGLVLRLGVQVAQRHLQDSPAQTIVGTLDALSAVDQGLANVSNGEDRGGLDVVPVFAGERVDAARLAQGGSGGAYIFFFRPFFPLESRLFLPTA